MDVLRVCFERVRLASAGQGSRAASRPIGIYVASLAVGLLLAGCALPGLDPDIDDSDNVEFYNPPGSDDERVLNYSPIVKEITPKLVLAQAKNRKDDDADLVQAGQSLSGASQPQNYQVGIGDVLGIIIYGHPELTNPTARPSQVGGGTISRTGEGAPSGHLVDASGEIYVPYVGTMEVAGKSINHIRNEISEGLSQYIRDPQVDIRVRQYRSKRVTVTGDISQPCVVPITDLRLTVVEALASCTALTAENDPGTTGVNAVQLVRNAQVHSLNLSRMYRQGGDAVALQDGDRLIVDDSFNRIFLMGEFQEQTAVPYSAGGMTLADAIASGGGFKLETADTESIYVIRDFISESADEASDLKTQKRPHIYHLDAGSASALILANQFQIQPRDIVFVAPASLVNFNRALAQITPSLNVLFQSALIYDRSTRNN